MSHNQGKAVNGVKSEKSPSKHVCPPGPHQHPHPAKPEAGDDSASEASHVDPLPENIHKRINALKNIHLDVQRIEQDMYGKLFLIEAEHHKKMATLLRKRAQIIAGTYEPTVQESEFSLKEGGDEKPETGPANDQKGVPDFWLDIFLHSAHTAQMLNEEDVEAIKFLVDVRCVYSEQPLGFTLEFEFKENPFFTNTVLTRSYVFGTEVSREEMYVSSGLAPKTTEGCQINWKEGKDTTKKEHITYQRNKKTQERRQIKTMKDQDSFFQFFQPKVTDLAALSKIVNEDDEEEAVELADKAEEAEGDFELASVIRTRVIPRALLIFTGEDEDDISYSDEEDFDDEDGDDEDDDDEDDGDHGDASDSDDSGDGPVKKGNGLAGGKGGKVVKGAGRRS